MFFYQHLFNRNYVATYQEMRSSGKSAHDLANDPRLSNVAAEVDNKNPDKRLNDQSVSQAPKDETTAEAEPELTASTSKSKLYVTTMK